MASRDDDACMWLCQVYPSTVICLSVKACSSTCGMLFCHTPLRDPQEPPRSGEPLKISLLISSLLLDSARAEERTTLKFVWFGQSFLPVGLKSWSPYYKSKLTTELKCNVWLQNLVERNGTIPLYSEWNSLLFGCEMDIVEWNGYIKCLVEEMRWKWNANDVLTCWLGYPSD